MEEIKNAGLDASLFESIKAELSLFQSKQQADAEHQSSTSSTLDMSMLDALLKDNGSPSTTNVEDESDAGASDDVSDGSESSDSGDSSSISTLSPDEWEKLVKLYHADPKTELEMDRFNHMSPMDREVFETAVTEDDLKLYHDQR